MISEILERDLRSDRVRPGDNVAVYWTAAGRAYNGTGRVADVNGKFVRVVLTETPSNYIGFAPGSEIQVPSSCCCPGWSHSNCVRPLSRNGFNHKDML